MNYLLSMLNYNKWANEQTLSSIETANEPDQKALDVFAHILNAEQIWIQRIKETVNLSPWDTKTLEECKEQMIKNNDEYTEFLSWLRPDELKRDVHYTDFKGESWSIPVQELFIHVFNHATYHRGQIAMLLRNSGNVPVSTDYLLTVRRVQE